MKYGVQEIIADQVVHTDQHIFVDGHGPEQADILEGAAHPALGDAFGGQPVQALALVDDGAAVRAVHSGQHIKQRGFACSVGSDHGKDLALLHVQADLAQRLQAAEPLGEMLNFKNHERQPAIPSSPYLPPGGPAFRDKSAGAEDHH